MMMECEGLIVADSNSYDDKLVLLTLNDVVFYASDGSGLKSSECVNFDRRIERCWHAYQPSRYALASR